MRPGHTRLMVTLAHLSDPHLAPVPTPEPGALAGKRLLGFLSWKLRRSAIHQTRALKTLCADLQAAHPDHVIVTGDLTNISLPGEFDHARSWLREQGAPVSVTVIPGNHDAYVPISWERSLGGWADYMSGIGDDLADPEEPATSARGFPFVRLRGQVALIGVSSARPTGPVSAAGKVGRKQLEALARRLRELGCREFFRVVLVHHPPAGGEPRRHARLLDREAFRACIARHGAELVLHGHTHRSNLARLATPTGYAPVIGTSSASAIPGRGSEPARYHLYRVDRQRQSWKLEVEVRGLSASHDGVSTAARFSLDIPG